MNDASRTIDSLEGQVAVNAGKPFESTIIPDSLWLGGLKIGVVYDENLYKNRKVVGEARYPTQTIVLEPTIQNKQSVEQNYHHELVHWILFMMNENELRTNEKFVDLFAHFLYQARASEQREIVPAKASDDPNSR